MLLYVCSCAGSGSALAVLLPLHTQSNYYRHTVGSPMTDCCL